jgi:hypothetical protein
MATALALELVNAALPIMSLALQHTTCTQAAGEMMPRRPLRAGLPAGEREVILAHPDDFFTLRPDAVARPDLRRRQGQAIGGLGLLAVSDHPDCAAPAQPTHLRPVGMSPMLTHRVASDPAVVLQTTDDRPAIVATALEEDVGGLPGLKEDVVRVTAQAIASIAASREGKDIR